MTHEYGRHNTNGVGGRNICIVHRKLSVEILYGLQRNCRSDEKMIIEMTHDNEIIRILSHGKEITNYSIKYIAEGDK